MKITLPPEVVEAATKLAKAVQAAREEQAKRDATNLATE